MEGSTTEPVAELSCKLTAAAADSNGDRLFLEKLGSFGRDNRFLSKDTALV